MRWSSRQQAMLRAMGLRLWGSAAFSRHDLQVGPANPETRPPSGGEDAVSALNSTVDVRCTGTISRRMDSPATEQTTQTDANTNAEPVDAADVARMDWSALRNAVSACKACTLCESRTQTVFGTGNANAHLMVVGEAPGVQEDRLGEPFVGKSGQLLDSMLRSIRLTRVQGPASQQVYIANTLKCRPPGNRNPMPEELAQCEPFLVRQIKLVRPRVVLAMGRFAVQALLRSNEPIGRLRGQIHHYHDVPLVVTYHPAYLLRNPLDKLRAWDDLRLAQEVLRRPERD